MTRALRVMRYVLAAATVAVCVLLCWQAVDLYQTGNSPENFSAPGVRIEPVYSREIVTERLAAVSPALFGYLTLVTAGLVLEAAAGEKRPPRSLRWEEERLRAARKRAAETPPEALAELRRRKIILLAAGAAVLLCVILGGAYLLDGAHFADLDLESVMGRLMLHTAPWAALGLTAAAAGSVLYGRSVRREIELLRAAPQRTPEPDRTVEKKNLPLGLRLALYAAAVLLIALGAANGGLWDVLVKAVNICTECIGLG